MKKCTSCRKEVKDSSKFCIHCGQVLSDSAESKEKEPTISSDTKGLKKPVTKKSPNKPLSKNRIGLFIVTTFVFVCVAIVGFIFANNKTDVSKENNKTAQTQQGNSDKPQSSSGNDNTDPALNVSDEPVSSAETDAEIVFSDTGKTISLPDNYSMEEIEAMINEFNTTTDEARKEQLRIILETIFKYE